MNRTNDPIEILDEPRPPRAEWMKWILPIGLLGLALVLVTVAAVSGPTPSLWNTADIVLFVLTALLCTLVAASLVLIGCGPWLTRIEAIHQGQGMVQTHMDAVQQGQGMLRTQVEAIQQAQWTVQARIEAIQQGQVALHSHIDAARQGQGTLRTQMEAVAETARQTMAAVMGLEAQREVTGTARTAVTAGQEQLVGNPRQLQELTDAVNEGFREVARAQAAAQSQALERGQVLTAALGALQQSQRDLHGQVATAVDSARQTIEAVAAIVAAQAAARETAQHVVDEMKGVGARQEQMAGDLRQLQDLAQTVGTGTAGVVGDQAAVPDPSYEQAQTLTGTLEALRQSHRDLHGQVATVADSARQIIEVATTLVAAQATARETAQHVVDEVKGVGARQEQMAGDLRQLQDLTQTVSAGVAEAAREQVLAHNHSHEQAQTLMGALETLQQSQRDLQGQVATAVDSTRQTTEAVAALGAGQAAARETAQQVVDEVKGVGSRQERMADGLRQLQDWSRTVGAGVTDAGREQAAVHNPSHEQAQTLTGAIESLQQSQRDLHGQVATAVDGARQIIEAVAALGAAQAAARETTQHVVDEVKGVGARQEQMAGDLRQLQDWTQAIRAGVADPAREQAAAHNPSHEQAQTLTGAIESLQQSQRDLHGQVATAVDGARQILEAVAALGAAQAAARETTQHVVDEVKGVGTRQEQMAGDLRQLQDWTQTIRAGVAEAAREQAAHNPSHEQAQTLTGALEALQQSQRDLHGQVATAVDSTRQIIEAVAALGAAQAATHETARQVADGMTGVGARQIALGEALEAHRGATGTALTAVTGGQEQLAGNLRRLQELADIVNAGVTEVARAQATAQSQAQERGQVVTATLEALRQSQQDLHGQVAAAADSARQSGEAVAAMGATQAAAREMAQHVVDEVKGIGRRQEQMAGDLRQLQDLTQTVGAGVAEATREQVAAYGHSYEQAQALMGAIEALQQSQRDLHGQMAPAADSARQTIEAVAAIVAAQAAIRETAQHVVDEVMGMGARQTALGEALQAHHEATRTALSAMTAGQEQLTGGLRQLEELTRTVGAGVAEVARDQAAVHHLSQEGTQALTAAIEALHRNRQELQAQIETATESARQTIEAVTTMAGEQNSAREAARHMIGEAAYAALAALTTSRRGLGTGDEPQQQALAQGIVGAAPGAVQPSAPAAEPAERLRLSAAQAVTHGEQIRYEAVDNRGNLGYWANADDWAEWEFELPRPGRFRVAAEIAALAAGRFQVTVDGQALEGTAPVTGDYGRFETVDLGVLELSAPGKTCLAIRPRAEDWQPMNLKSLDLVPVA